MSLPYQAALRMLESRIDDLAARPGDDSVTRDALFTLRCHCHERMARIRERMSREARRNHPIRASIRANIWPVRK